MNLEPWTNIYKHCTQNTVHSWRCTFCTDWSLILPHTPTQQHMHLLMTWKCNCNVFSYSGLKRRCDKSYNLKKNTQIFLNEVHSCLIHHSLHFPTSNLKTLSPGWSSATYLLCQDTKAGHVSNCLVCYLDDGGLEISLAWCLAMALTLYWFHWQGK